ncbi:ASCH domain-containing protein [Rhizobium leguminosarum]|uniref:ASCH domain-containing protein n=1 Tax=Rhizobium leguminosarum TaxID=384 RepID=UPI002E110DC9|nr:hypothetical protein U8Q02_37650 [Rhizobium leguminosarum]
MQQLAISGDLVASTLAGRKKNTIRAGRRDIVTGPLRLVPGDGSPSFVVEVAEVGHKLADEVTMAEIRENGFAGQRDMLSGMRRFYPHFGPKSEVTVVRWK